MTPESRNRWLVRTLFVAAMAMASRPAWRVALLDSEPTLAELQQLICAAPAAAVGAASRP